MGTNRPVFFLEITPI